MELKNYLKKLLDEKKELEFEKYSVEILLRRLDDEIERIEQQIDNNGG